MKEISISCGNITAIFKTPGAELISLKKGDVEYLWQGNPEFWDGQSPLLFPNTGRYWDNRYFLDGQIYEQKAHGFARNSEFDVVEQSADKVVFGLHSDSTTEAVYPFKFFLFVTYQVSEQGLTVDWFVRNQGDNDMYFQIGAHPAFNLPNYCASDKIHGYITFEPKCQLQYLEPLEKGCVDPTKLLPLTLDEYHSMPLTGKTFDCDTYVIESGELQACTLQTADRRPWVTVEFSMPVLALWAPTVARPDCPFVCIEPWYGSCDTIGYSGDIANRRHEQHLASGEHFMTRYRIKI